MANNVSNVSFMNPYAAEQADIERRRALAGALQGQSMQPIESGSAGGWVTPVSPFQGLSKIAQAAAGAYGAKRSDEKQAELGQRSQNDYRAMVARGLKQLSGTPASAMSEDASGNVTPAQPAIPPDALAALATFGEHPGGAALAPLAMQDIGRQRMIESLRRMGQQGQPVAPQAQQGNPMAPGGGSVMAPGGGAPAAPQAPQQPQAGPQMGGPAGGIPLEAWMEVDPSGKTYLSELAKQQAEADKPVINRGYGVGRMVNGKYVADQASLDQALAMERGKQGIQAPMEAPVTLKTTGGQEIQLSRPEWADFQKTGQLPARIGGQQPPAGGAGPLPQGMGQPLTLGAGLGIPGVSQSQQDTIRQQGQTASNTEAGREFIAEMRQNYAKLRDVPATLANIERAKGLAAGSAANFMGPLGDSKLALTKFFRANVPGMANLNTDKVTSAEELQSTLFNQVMDNLKKMDASPSQYQQQVMQEAFGTLRTDPASVPKIMDVFSDILRNRVDLHNQTVKSAEGRGTTFPYDVSVKLPSGAKRFASEEEAAAAGLKPGTRVIINGVPGVWQ